MSNFEIIVANLPNREELVAEIYCNNEYWVGLSDEKLDGNLIAEFYKPRNSEYWEFPLDEALEALSHAKKRLIGMGAKIID